MKTVIAFLSVVLWLSVSSFAADVVVLPAEIRGVVLYPDGETPVNKLRVSVWDAKAETVVYRTKTDKNGVFDIPKFSDGDYYVIVGGIKIDMAVLKPKANVNPQPHGFVVVVPRRQPMTVMPTVIPASIGAAAAPQVISP